MEMLEDRIKVFLRTDYDSSGHGHDSCEVYNYYNGRGYGCGDGFGSGSTRCVGRGNSCGNIYGHGFGNGEGNGFGNSYGEGEGSGYSHSSGLGDGVKEVNGDTVYIVDNVPTIIKSVRDNIVQGFVLQGDLTLTPCYIVKEQNKFAHGNTLHDAFTALQEKLYGDSTEEERIEAFHKKFPKYDTPYPNRDLFAYHHVLTGSCRMGRESFCQNNGIDLNGSTTVREFIELTKGSYGGDVICKLPEVYGVK